MGVELAQEIKAILTDQANEVKAALGQVTAAHEALNGQIGEIQTKIDAHGAALSENKSAFQEQVDKVEAAEQRLDNLVAKIANFGNGPEQQKTMGQQVAASDVCKSFVGGAAHLASVAKPRLGKDITNDPASGGATVQPYRRPDITGEAGRVLTIRDLLLALSIASNAVEWARENVFTNAAATRADGAASAESNITFTKETTAVQIISHWFAVSRTLLSDSLGLASFVDMRGVYGLALAEETQLLLGDGLGSNLKGLIPSATAYDAGLNASGDKKLDMARKSILQVSKSGYIADGVVLNPTDWCNFELMKTTEGAYIFHNPADTQQPRLWGKRVVESMTMTAGDFLTGAFAQAATLWDREQLDVRVAEQHGTFAIQGMVALIFEERLALTVERPLALVTGTLADTI